MGSPPNMGVVFVSTLEAQLAMKPPEDVLLCLAGSNALLRSPSVDTKVALVSYRHERGCGSPDTTLDGEALLKIVAAAKRGKIDALWLDVWCYRFSGDYVHTHFTKTLSSVIAGVAGVVWLPRSKAEASGTYGFRLWCTFEAACVERLKLPVYIAGHGLSLRQRNLVRFGSFTPALWAADGVTDSLCRYNLSFYLVEASLFLLTLTSFLRGKYAYAGVCCAGLFCVGPAMWTALRNQGRLGLERRLANNAKRVMRILLSASAGEVLDDGCVSGLLSELPWLPAHDRRDVMVVQELLGQIAPECVVPGSTVHALALSIYVASAFAPAPGEGSVRTLSIGRWLVEKDIVLSKTGTGTSHSKTGLQRNRLISEAGVIELPLAELRQLGWRVVRGSFVTSALATPLGILASRPPTRLGRCDVWHANSAILELVEYHTMSQWGTYCWGSGALNFVALSIEGLLVHAGVVEPGAAFFIEMTARYFEILICISFVMILCRCDLNPLVGMPAVAPATKSRHHIMSDRFRAQVRLAKVEAKTRAIPALREPFRCHALEAVGRCVLLGPLPGLVVFLSRLEHADRQHCYGCCQRHRRTAVSSTLRHRDPRVQHSRTCRSRLLRTTGHHLFCSFSQPTSCAIGPCFGAVGRGVHAERGGTRGELHG
jgi:hypothetical protein